MPDSALPDPFAAAGVPARAPVRWRDELAGGINGALVAFPIAVPLGALAFAPLGPGFAGTAVAAALTSAALGAFAATLVGSEPRLRSGPVTAVCLVINTLLTGLLASPALAAPGPSGLPRAIAFAFACTLLAAMLQIALGALHLGQAIKFVPRPVLAGFRNGLAILIGLAQLPPLLGLARAPWHYDLADLAASVLPWTVAVGLATMGAIALARRWRFNALALLLGLLVGTALDEALRAIVGGAALGALVGHLPELPRLGKAWTALVDVSVLMDEGKPIVSTVASAIGLALIGAVLSLLTVRVVEDVTHGRADGNRELLAQGVGNAVAACVGSVPIAGSPSPTLASIRAGARTRWAAATTALILLATVVLAGEVIGRIPTAALAGVMLAVAYDMFDRETFDLVADVRARTSSAGESLVDLGLIGAVAVASLAFNIVAGVAAGVVISAAIFAVKSSRNTVRRQATGATRHSLRQRSTADMRLLASHGNAIAILELEGPVFFGTAERLADEVERQAGTARFVILDWRRVNAIDATGAHVLGALARRLRTAGTQLAIAAVAGHDGQRRTLHRECPDELAAWFPDADRALEWCEERLLATLPREAAPDGEIDLGQVDVFRQFDATELALLRAALVREVHPPGAVLFREGDAGDCLYVLTRGAVSMLLRGSGDASSTRLATFMPGVVFGELAVLEGRPRSADGVCETDSVLYVLSRAALQKLDAEDPALAIKFYKAIALMLAGRLRATTQELRLVVAD